MANQAGSAQRFETQQSLVEVPAHQEILTLAGRQTLEQELERLMHQERPEVVRVVQWAASNGDRSENADYQYGKRRLREIDRRVQWIQSVLGRAWVLEPQECAKRFLKMEQMGVAMWCQYQHSETEQLHWVQLVGSVESDPPAGRINHASPLGRALLGAKRGESREVRPPGREPWDVVILEFGWTKGE